MNPSPQDPTPLTTRFIHDLRERMKELKIKKTTLAAKIGTSKYALSRWFQLPPTRKPTGEFILRIQEFLKNLNLF